jgi:hypothetical protein
MDSGNEDNEESGTSKASPSIFWLLDCCNGRRLEDVLISWLYVYIMVGWDGGTGATMFLCIKSWRRVEHVRPGKKWIPWPTTYLPFLV